MILQWVLCFILLTPSKTTPIGKQISPCWDTDSRINRLIYNGQILVRQIEKCISRKTQILEQMEQQTREIEDCAQRLIEARDRKDTVKLLAEESNMKQYLKQLYATLYKIDQDEVASFPVEQIDEAHHPGLLQLARMLLLREDNIRQRLQSDLDFTHQRINYFHSLIALLPETSQCEQRQQLAYQLQASVKELDNIKDMLRSQL